MNKAKWIWQNCNNRNDEYVKFYDEFECIDNDIFIDISCDSNYTLYVNGGLAGFGQYADYPHYKVYDRINLTSFVYPGKNKILIIVWYYGDNSSVYTRGNAGLIYEVKSKNDILSYSDAGKLCKITDDYINYCEKKITKQIGFSYKYDTRNYDGYDKKNFFPKNYDNAIEVLGISYDLHLRPIKRLELKETSYGKLINSNRNIYDLGCERVGFLHIKFKAPKGTLITISYGEHINDGEVRRLIDGRDFSIELYANGEYFEYLNTFRRLGLRYLQIICDENVDVEFVGIKETMYPINLMEFRAKSELEQNIYDVSIRTLMLCMHEHYEDCPWREQAMYTMDSRNQMLCGYYAFKEFEYPRANLILISKAYKANKLLPLCFPAGIEISIPFFSLIFIVQMNEYTKYSKDLSLIGENIAMLRDIANVFIEKIEENDLIGSFKDYWNFYEWREGLEGDMNFNNYTKSYDLPLNCFLIWALENLIEICNLLKVENYYHLVIQKLQNAVFSNFYNNEKGLFKSFVGKDDHYSKLCNSLAVLTGCAFEHDRALCEKMVSHDVEMTDVTLSMKVFEYDALLKIDMKYMDFVINDIDTNYKYMLDNGATTFWETILGEKDFNKAGSLCHGWSAIPVYYYNMDKS